jgi:hypothetical protein
MHIFKIFISNYFLLSKKNSSAKDIAMQALTKVEADLGKAFASLGILRE